MTLFTILCATTYLNLTDVLIELFGFGGMQQLWAPLIALFDALEALLNLDLSLVWEILFT